jgi:CheY-like chemotaxis protein
LVWAKAGSVTTLCGQDILTGFRESIRSFKSTYALQVKQNGESALALLREMPPAWRPDLIVTDWNMPGMNGGSVVRTLTQDSRFLHIPVVVFTSSTQVRELAMRSDARAFFVKPPDLEEYSDCLAQMEDVAVDAALSRERQAA